MWPLWGLKSQGQALASGKAFVQMPGVISEYRVDFPSPFCPVRMAARDVGGNVRL